MRSISHQEGEDVEEALCDFFEQYVPQFDGFCKLMKLLLEEDCEIYIELNPSKVSKKGSMRYDYADNKIYFVDIAQLNGDGLVEEIIHYVQYNIFGYNMTYELRNVEFEAKMCFDMFLWACDMDTGVRTQHGFTGNITYIQMYYDFIKNFTANDCKMNEDLWQQYHELGRGWDDLHYHSIKSYVESAYDRGLNALIIEYLLN